MHFLRLRSLAVPRVEDRVPLDFKSAVLILLPTVLCLYAMAVLVLVPGTRLYRLALLPLVVALCWRAATRCDASGGSPKYNHNNYGHGIAQFSMSLRMIDWALRREPLDRPQRPSPASLYQDAHDLCSSIRGIGWKWSKGLNTPPETRPTHSNTAFMLSTALRALRDLVICDAIQAIIHVLGPDTFGSLQGGTIFDARLTPFPRYLFSTLLTLLTGTGIYFSLNMTYHAATLAMFVLAPRQDPAMWPPLSVAPWAAVSLRDFWGRRWHQLFRHMFVRFGARPAHALLGRPAGVLGVFALSAVMHDVCIWGMGRGTAFRQIGGFFLLSGVGVLAEQAFERITARKVQGFAGWCWTMLFLLGTGNLLIDAWLTRGLAGASPIPDCLRPTWWFSLWFA